jgi:small Trp-rich protein
MLFVVVGVLLLAMKLAEFGPVGNWSWWPVLTPFGLAVLWWAWADMTGFTKRRAMDKMEAKKDERRRKNLEALGIDPRSRRKEGKKAEAFARSRAFQVSKIEGRRDKIRQKNKEALLRGSRFDSSMDSRHVSDSELEALDKKAKR